MFNKIWYPEDGFVDVSRFGIRILFPPVLLLSLFVNFYVTISLYMLIFIFSWVVTLRGAMTLELDPKSNRFLKTKAESRKGTFVAISILFVLLLLVCVIFVPKKYLQILPGLAGMSYMIIVLMQGFRVKTILFSLSVLTVAVFTVTAYFSMFLALVMTGFFIAGVWPLAIETVIEKERFLKGDFERKFPPSLVQGVDQE